MAKHKLVFSCIIINMNGAHWLRNLFETLKIAIAATKESMFEVIMVDNGSTDSSIQIFEEIKGFDSRYKLIQNKLNEGWSPAVNQGLEASSGEYVFLLSNDMEIDEHSMVHLIERFKELPKVGIIQFNSISIFDRKTQDSGRCYIDPMGFIYGYNARSGIDRVSFAEGMAFALRRQVIDEVGLLDSSYYMMYDDVDYSWRTRLMGWDIILEPKSIVYHYRGGTIGKNFENMDPKFITLATKNHLTTIIKNTEIHNLMLTLAFAVFIKTLESVYLMLKVDFKKGLLNMYGIMCPFINLRGILRKRHVVQITRKIKDRQLFNSFHVHDLRMLIDGSILTNPATRGRMRKSNEEAIMYKKGA